MNIILQTKIDNDINRWRVGSWAGRFVAMAAIFICLALAFHFLSDGLFISPRNITLLSRQAAIAMLLAAGVSILIVMGEIDLSIGSAVYLCSIVAASAQSMYGWDTVTAVAVTIVTGIVLGAWNGVLVTRIGVPSFVATLAGLLAFRGLGYYLTDAATISPMAPSFVNISEGFVPVVTTMSIIGVMAAASILYVLTRIRRGRPLMCLLVLVVAGISAWAFGGYRGIPMAIVVVLSFGVVLSVVMHRTVFGRNSYVVGSNREAAKLAGISVQRNIFAGFVVMGALYGVAAVLMTARLDGATPTAGTYMELDAIAGAVIGGTSLRGGIGTIGGALVGALLLVTIDNGMSLLNVSSFVQMVVKGLVLLVAVAFDTFVSSKK
ncbi:MAG: hypothetical protein ABJN75_04105 [Hoeflea sp.]|uniref:sugar ABC transporter permease n=1 Tax=Hoeflea sp. TaxID=1940281 RepID=UPI0032989C4A